MQAERISIAVLVIASFIVAATHAQGQTIAPSADSFIRAVGSDANEGTTTFMRLQNSGDNRTLVRFD